MPVQSAEQYIEVHPNWREELSALRKMLLSTELEEEIKWGAPVYTLKGKNIIGLAAFKNHCAMWFFNGASFKENTALLENAQPGKTKALRQIRFKKGEEIKPEVLLQYVAEAIANQKLGNIVKPEISKQLVLPSALTTTFKEDEELEAYFAKLPDCKQREYAEYIIEAKKESKKQERIEKIIPLIKNGAGLNDHYRKV